MYKHMLTGFVTGAVTGALLGVFFGGFKATNTDPDSPTFGQGGQLRIGTLLKYSPPAADASVMTQVNLSTIRCQRARTLSTG